MIYINAHMGHFLFPDKLVVKIIDGIMTIQSSFRIVINLKYFSDSFIFFFNNIFSYSHGGEVRQLKLD